MFESLVSKLKHRLWFARFEVVRCCARSLPLRFLQAGKLFSESSSWSYLQKGFRTQPPSTASVTPVMYEARSDARNATAAAISSGWAIRRMAPATPTTQLSPCFDLPAALPRTSAKLVLPLRQGVAWRDVVNRYTLRRDFV